MFYILKPQDATKFQRLFYISIFKVVQYFWISGLVKSNHGYDKNF